jgi:hypothetical protein
VLLTVPTRGQIAWQTVTRLEEIRDETPGLAPILYEPGNLSVAQTRNQIVRKFMDTDKELLVMVDDDVVPPPHLLERCFADMGGHAMVGVPYPLWRQDQGLFLSVFERGPDGLRLAELREGLNTVDALGTGCVAVTRDALARMGRNPFRFDNSPELEGVSEDFIFCADLQREGFTIGCFWDGWYADHVRAVGLAPLLESQLRQPAERSGSWTS